MREKEIISKMLEFGSDKVLRGMLKDVYLITELNEGWLQYSGENPMLRFKNNTMIDLDPEKIQGFKIIEEKKPVSKKKSVPKKKPASKKKESETKGFDPLED